MPWNYIFSHGLTSLHLQMWWNFASIVSFWKIPFFLLLLHCYQQIFANLPTKIALYFCPLITTRLPPAHTHIPVPVKSNENLQSSKAWNRHLFKKGNTCKNMYYTHSFLFGIVEILFLCLSDLNFWLFALPTRLIWSHIFLFLETINLQITESFISIWNSFTSEYVIKKNAKGETFLVLDLKNHKPNQLNEKTAIFCYVAVRFKRYYEQGWRKGF